MLGGVAVEPFAADGTALPGADLATALLCSGGGGAHSWP